MEWTVISVKDLANERLILLSQHSFLRHQIDDAFSNAGVAANVIVDTPHSLVACGLVAAGAGITLVSRWAAELFSAHDVVVRPLGDIGTRIEPSLSRLISCQATFTKTQLMDQFDQSA